MESPLFTLLLHALPLEEWKNKTGYDSLFVEQSEYMSTGNWRGYVPANWFSGKVTAYKGKLLYYMYIGFSDDVHLLVVWNKLPEIQEVIKTQIHLRQTTLEEILRFTKWKEILKSSTTLGKLQQIPNHSAGKALPLQTF